MSRRPPSRKARGKASSDVIPILNHAEIEEKIYGARGVSYENPQEHTFQNVLALPSPDGTKLRELPMMQSAKKRSVTVIEQPVIDYPEMYLTVFVLAQGNYEMAQFANMFVKGRCMKADKIDDADLVIFTGGTDVDSHLYGEDPHDRNEHPDRARDNYEIGVFKECLEKGIPMLGVCRGAQFLHVMNGGKLYQHVDNHTGNHTMFDPVRKEQIERVSSVHHQMVMDNERLQIHGQCYKSQNRYTTPKERNCGSKLDIEAFFYPDTLCMGIQGHPEYQGYEHFTKWSLQFIEDCVVMNPDLVWLDGQDQPRVRRLHPEAIATRSFQLPELVQARINKESL